MCRSGDWDRLPTSCAARSSRARNDTIQAALMLLPSMRVRLRRYGFLTTLLHVCRGTRQLRCARRQRLDAAVEREEFRRLEHLDAAAGALVRGAGTETW